MLQAHSIVMISSYGATTSIHIGTILHVVFYDVCVCCDHEFHEEIGVPIRIGLFFLKPPYYNILTC